MSLFQNVTEYMQDNGMLTNVKAVVVGVSGGADSVALLRVLCEFHELTIKVVHINHMIRGEEADRDEAFVTQLCEILGVSCTVYREDIPKMAREKHMTEEEAGRIFRYECFNKEAEALKNQLNDESNNKSKDTKDIDKAVRIAVAHNMDDLAETVLFNMVRGSSLLGLAGIKPVNGRIIRPLLMTSRVEIEEYLGSLGQSYITDSTNLVEDYTRNKIRLSIIPQLREINDGATSHIVEIAKEARQLSKDINLEIDRDYYQEIKQESRGNIADTFQRCEIDISVFQRLSSLAKGELVLSMMESICGRRKDITRDHISLVSGLTGMESGKSVNLPYDMYAYRSYDKIVISKNPRKSDAADSTKVNESASFGVIETEVIPYDESLDLSKKEYTKLIDYDKINFVPVLRTPESDDFIVVSQDGGSKKLSRFFTHSKVDREARISFPVVADGSEIIWAVGLRLSERYKVTAGTKNVMRITYKKQ